MKLDNNNVYIRKAAGAYWIVRTGDAVLEYQNPIMLNETGAKIYELLEKGYSKRRCCKSYGERVQHII